MDVNAAPPTDFDFAVGEWTVVHRRLAARLQGSTEWVEFPGTMSTRKVLGGFGNVEDNLLELPGDAYRAVALRSFDRDRGVWSIWWLDGRAPGELDVPVVGRFDAGIGTFFAEAELDGRPIRIRFIWTTVDADHPRWEQAFSADGGATWETNWTMDFTRVNSARQG
ncbi:DUF1579 family protein [Lysobacter claricitrinus]|uniref:DUF1579 family protein n=1 Tax=Lysobacter claricitrinus TaxID=3367728 RepID=UPI0037DB0285